MEYTKPGEPPSSRSVIPTSNTELLYAMDVSDMGVSEREDMQDLYIEYNNYLKERRLLEFKFEDWVSHTYEGKVVTPKWRSFKTDRMKIV